MGNNAIPISKNGMMHIRGVMVELIASPSQTWDVPINGVVYHITQEQEESLLRAVLYHDDYPSPNKIAKFSYSGKEGVPPSPATMAQIVKISHTCVDPTTNLRKPCSEVFGIRGYGYMSRWKAFWYGFPFALAIYIWVMLMIMAGTIMQWIFTISPGTPFSVPGSVFQNLLILGLCVGGELCFKPGRKYLKAWFGSKPLWIASAFWIGFVIVTAIDHHKSFVERSENFIMAAILVIVILGCIFLILFSAVNCGMLILDAIEEGEDVDTIDKYV